MTDDHEPDEVVELEITDVLDLHSFPASETAGVVESYLEVVLEMGLRSVRIIHGRGIGAQRRTVRTLLARHPQVRSYSDAPTDGGGWGATVVTLKSKSPKNG